MFDSLAARRLRLAALAFLGCAVHAAAARAQDRVVFSLSSSATTPFGTLNDTELAQYDPVTATVKPWLRDATAAYFGGDVNGDGQTDVWKDVDALAIVMATPHRIGEVYLSFGAGFGPFLDGDIVRLTADGQLAVAWSEAQIVAAFGCTDGSIDVDALDVRADGTLLLSFGDDEASSSVSTDQPNVITDGSVLGWDPASGLVSVVFTEGAIDTMVSNALGKAVKTGDTLSVAVDAGGLIDFTVQGPSSDDATVFSSAGNGSIAMSEASLGLVSTVEIDALAFMPATADFPVGNLPTRIVPSSQQLTIDVDGAANRSFIVLLALARGDTDAFPLPGWKGLALPVGDPLFRLSIGGVPFLFGTTDATGRGSVTLPNAPAGLVLTLFAQPFDLDEGVLGTPLAAELTG